MNLIKHKQGLTLIETLLVLAIIGILASITIPSYLNARGKAKICVAISDIENIEKTVTGYQIDNGDHPSSLTDIGLDGLKDPWGNPYEYWPITGNKNQKVRKDRNTHPINTDFDLFSKGKDEKTDFPLTAKASQDDIIRANNGGFIGLASKY